MQRNWLTDKTATINTIFQAQAQKYGDRDMLLEKVNGTYSPLSWREVALQVRELALGLHALGVQPGECVALMMSTQANWVIADLAILGAGAVNVPIYPTNKAHQVAHILNDSVSSVIFAGSSAILKEIVEIWDEAKQLRAIIVPDGTKKTFGGEGLTGRPAPLCQVLERHEVLMSGRRLDSENPALFERLWQRPLRGDLASVIYTSGTTGNPKGVMLTHDNFISNAQGALAKVPVHDYYVNMSFLPLSHVLERTTGYYGSLISGATIAYAEDIASVARNMLEVRPHSMACVPRLYEKIYERIIDSVNAGSPLKKKIFRWAREVGRENARLLAERKQARGLFKIKLALADVLVFKKIRARFGGRLAFCISGGAPLGRELAEFFNGMNIRVLEGYGLTETSPIITFNSLDEIRYGSVGKVIPCGEVRIAPDGEVLSRGPQNCLGYFNNPEATAELIDSEGWLRTGDIGHLDKDGFLFITDRKKDIIVTSGGKNVAPQPLEGLLSADRYVQQAVIQGDKRNYLVAMLAPDFEQLQHYARERNLSWQGKEDLLALPEVRKLYAERVAEILGGRPAYEQVKRICLRDREFTMEEKELTPTLKVRRRFIFEKYCEFFDNLYAGCGDYIEIRYANESID